MYDSDRLCDCTAVLVRFEDVDVERGFNPVNCEEEGAALL